MMLMWKLPEKQARNLATISRQKERALSFAHSTEGLRKPILECSERRARMGRVSACKPFLHEKFLSFQQNVLLAESQNRYDYGWAFRGSLSILWRGSPIYFASSVTYMFPSRGTQVLYHKWLRYGMKSGLVLILTKVVVNTLQPSGIKLGYDIDFAAFYRLLRNRAARRNRVIPPFLPSLRSAPNRFSSLRLHYAASRRRKLLARIRKIRLVRVRATFRSEVTPLLVKSYRR